MRIAVLGTGIVGRSLASKWVELGHDVRLGSRSSASGAGREWADSQGDRAGVEELAAAAAFGEVVVNALPGDVCLPVLAALSVPIGDKVLIDVANPLDFSHGFPPRLSVVNTDSLGEQIQRALPRAKVVKALNTVTAELMVRPALLPAPSDLFVAGDDIDGKQQVTAMLVDFGWSADVIHDLGGIEAARGTEMYLPLWLNLMGALGTVTFNIHVVLAEADAPTG